MIDYTERAELFLGSTRHTANEQGPRAFGSAAKALRFAFEEAAPVSLRGARLRVGRSEFVGERLAALYRATAYPLPRKASMSSQALA